MKSRILKSLAVFIFVLMVFFFAMAGYQGMTGGHGDFGSPVMHSGKDVARGTKAGNVSQNMGGGNSLRAEVPDGALVSESKMASYVRYGRAEAGAADYLVLLLSVFLFLFEGRPWSAVRSICMEFLGYAMRQIHILQLRDGKKRSNSYSTI